MDQESLANEIQRRWKSTFWTVLGPGFLLGLIVGWAAGINMADTIVIIPLENGVEV